MKDTKSVKIRITDMNENDGLYWAKDSIIGKEFDAQLLLGDDETGFEGWVAALGLFTEKTGVDDLDEATYDEPVFLRHIKFEYV